MTANTFEHAVDNFFSWSWQLEFIVTGIIAVAMLVVSWYLFKREKKNAGWVCLGIGAVVLLTDITRLIIQMAILK